MENKIQNCLTGTIVLVILGIIIFPKLFNRQKKNSQNEYIAISPISKSCICNKLNTLPVFITQELPSSKMPENAEKKEYSNNNTTVASLPEPSRLATNGENDFYLAPKLEREKSKLDSFRDRTNKQLINDTEMPPIRQVQKNKSTAVSKIYIVQLGALKNVDKVNEIVNKLRNMRYHVYTLPNASTQGKITRILVNLNTSKDELKNSLVKLKKLSGMSGIVMNYSTD